MTETAYRATRRKGVKVTVVAHVTTSVNGTTGQRTSQTTVHNVRQVVVEPTTYSRTVKAQAAQQNIGPTTFIFWTRDIPFRSLTQESYCAYDGKKFQVVSSTLEEDGLIITAKETVGDPPNPVVTINVSNSLGMSDSVDAT